MDEMVHHLKAVRRGAKKSFVIGDLPLKGVEKGPLQVLRSAKRFMEEAGADAVKLEWQGADTIEVLKLLSHAKIPVMGHVGLTPQTVSKKEGFGMRGKEASTAFQIVKQALLFETGGAFSVLIECVPNEVAKAITDRLKIPTIGIGAGFFCDGQVLVFHDLVGLFMKFKPHFVKRYANLYGEMEKAVGGYLKDVRARRFPGKENGFTMKPDELKFFKGFL